jgi:hypothetical protein
MRRMVGPKQPKSTARIECSSRGHRGARAAARSGRPCVVRGAGPSAPHLLRNSVRLGRDWCGGAGGFRARCRSWGRAAGHRRSPIGLALVRDVDQAGRMDAAVALGPDRPRLFRSRRLDPPPYQRAPPPHGRARRAEMPRGALDRAEAVKRWSAEALETAVVEAGGCAAAMRTAAEWGLIHRGERSLPSR